MCVFLFCFVFLKNWYQSKQSLVLVPLHVRRKIYRTLNSSVAVMNTKQITSQVGSTMLKRIGLTARAGVAERRQ